MAPSPRKRASTFDQTWHETDVAFLDPTSLPIAKVPRAWERKAEPAFTRDAKYKQVWRRHAPRAQTAHQQTSSTDPSEGTEGHTSPDKRAVKKLRTRPEGSEDMASKKKNARGYAATRYDRRKSVLPRKRVTRQSVKAEDAQLIETEREESLDDAPADVSELSEQEDDVGLQTTETFMSDDTNAHSFSFQVESSNAYTKPKDEGLVEGPEEIQASSTEGRTSSPDLGEVLTEAHEGFGDEVQQISSTVTDVLASPEGAAGETTAEGLTDGSIPEVEEAEDFEARLASALPEPLEGDIEDSDGLSEPQAGAEHSSLAEPSEIKRMDDSASNPPPVEVSNEIFDEHQEEQLNEESDPAPSVLEAVGSEEASVVTEVGQSNEGPDGLQEYALGEGSNIPQVDGSLEIEREAESEGQEEEQEQEEPEEEIVMDDTITSNEIRTSGCDTENPVQTPQSDKFDEDVEMSPAAEYSANLSVDVGPPATALVTSANPTDQTDDIVAETAEQAMEQDSEQTTKDIQAPPLPPSIADTAAIQSVEQPPDNIADGLTLPFGPSTPAATETPRKGRSPTPPPAEMGQDDLTYSLDDDTAILKDFLSRAAASKASKEKKAASIARRTSLQNRRDSGAVRHALASPRKILEDKDPNSPSHHKQDTTATFDLSQTLTLNLDEEPPLSPSQAQSSTDANGDAEAPEEPVTTTSGRPSSRRSTRTRTSRIPPPGSVQPKTIPVRRADGGEPVVLRRSEAQELGLLTRANTRKNKQGAVSASMRLLKLAAEAKNSPALEMENPGDSNEGKKGKGVMWDETLVYFQDGNTDSLASVVANASTEAELEGAAESSADELVLATSTPKLKSRGKAKVQEQDSSTATPRLRRLKGLGAANGTPAKGLLAPASSFPDEVVEQQEKATSETGTKAGQQALPQPQRLPKPSKAKRLPVAAPPSSVTAAPTMSELQVPSQQNQESKQPVADEVKTVAKEKKSKLATPRKIKLPKPVTASTGAAVALEGKENQSQNRSIGGITPKKGIPVIQIGAAGAGSVESGLPRRRGQRRV